MPGRGRIAAICWWGCRVRVTNSVSTSTSCVKTGLRSRWRALLKSSENSSASSVGGRAGSPLLTAQRFDHSEVPLDMIEIEHDVVAVAVAVRIARHHGEETGFRQGLQHGLQASEDAAGVVDEHHLLGGPKCGGGI